MKTSITAQQLVHFRQQGHIRFEDFPVDFPSIQSSAQKDPEKRDLWRRDARLKKLILRTLAPLALELTGKKALRLASDLWLDTPYTTGRQQDLFCFQGLAAIFDLSSPADLDIFEPSSLSSLLVPHSYLVLFALENVRYIENPRDEGVPQLKRMGYAFGDVLANEFHPLIHPR